MFQEAIGKQNIESQLNKLATSPRILASIEEMETDIKNGDRGKYDAKDYYHNKRIKIIIDRARKRAWATILSNHEVQTLLTKQKSTKKDKNIKGYSSSNAGVQPLLNIYK